MIRKHRQSGILLHITSLPSAYGIGDLGPAAYQFADFLADAHQRLWQMLPLNPTDPGSGNSPYSSASAFAGNVLLISLDMLERQGYLRAADLVPLELSSAVDYHAVIEHRRVVLSRAYETFRSEKKFHKGYEGFYRAHARWLDDYALYIVLQRHFGEWDWSRWPLGARDRHADTLSALSRELSGDIEREKFFQYLFFSQWYALRDYCHKKGIRLIGDIPIYVNYNSADTWSNQEIFKLGADKKPSFVGGVPPDYFSVTGQRWGNPVYDWDVLKKTRYAWWCTRLAHVFGLFDIVRIDHFRGLVGYWEIPAEEETAINGQWVPVPADDFFTELHRRFPRASIIAEDLGVITADVKAVMKRFKFPGMRILMFAFGDDDQEHPYLPHNYIRACVAMTGTHDNNTVVGWYAHDVSPQEKERVVAYLGKDVSSRDMHWELVQRVMDSAAGTVVFPLQDILGFGQEARMNRPSVPEGNWQWRVLPEVLTAQVAQRLREITRRARRG